MVLGVFIPGSLCEKAFLAIFYHLHYNMFSSFGYLVFLVVSICSSCYGVALSSDDLQYIEAALANISSKVATLSTTTTNADTGIAPSLTSITNLLQLSVLRGLLADSTTSSNNDDSGSLDEQKTVALFERLEALVNTTIANQEMLLTQSSDNQETIMHLQKQVTAMSSTLNSVKNDVRQVLQNTANSTSGSSSEEEFSPVSLPHSCEEIKSSSPNSPSDYYTIVDNEGRTRHVYCHMGELCGSAEGWTRIALLNMSNPEEKCPDGFKQYEERGVRACGRYSSGCVSTTFPSDGISYSEVCGRVTGYQYHSTNGPEGSDINGAYIDGISLTHGNPRTHIWSFMAGYRESGIDSNCPCGTVGSRSPPSFVGKHYYCEAGAVTVRPKLYIDDPLWDGKGCGPIEGPCCNRPLLPWFYRSFSYTTNDYIEMRVCCNQDIDNEDSPVSYVEIYVK